MLHAPHETKSAVTIHDFMRSSGGIDSSGHALIDMNAVDNSHLQLCEKDIQDSDLHHVLKVILFISKLPLTSV